MKRKRVMIIVLSFFVLVSVGIAAYLLLANRDSDKYKDNLMLYLALDDGTGTAVKDASENLEDGELNYLYSHAAFMDSQEPQWRKTGVKGGSLLFDGNSTYITYNKNDIGIEGQSFSISVWVAPRTFEWDAPNAAENGSDMLTGIISQCNKEKNQGVLLGYQRFGSLSFQVGTGDEWLSIWTNGDNLKKYEWNHIAATFDGVKGEMCLYLNGELVASRSVPVGASIEKAKKQLLIGRNNEAERLMAGFRNVCSGLMDEVKLYNCVLPKEDIVEYYNNVDVPEIVFSDIWLQNILTSDVTKPQYHGGPYQNWMNEPHAPLYYNGKYHLFFQQNMSGSYWRNICWGHLVSDDMVSWTPVKEAITPTENSVVPDGVWSGAATTDKNGVPLLFFTAGNDDFASYEGLISNQNIGVAYPSDLSDPNLIDWVIYDELAIKQERGQGRIGEFRDPHIWKEDDTWCMLICSGSTKTKGGTALLYTTKTLELKEDGTIDMDWKYVGPVYEMSNPSATFGTSWELPIILPVSNESGTIQKYMFAFSPAPASTADNKVYYYVGDFNIETGKFTPDEAFAGGPHILDYGCNVFTGPSAFIDPVSGNVYMFSIMQDQRTAADQGASGWAHNVGLTRKIWLNDQGTDLMVAAVEGLSNIEGEVLVDETNLTMSEANEKLTQVKGDMLHLKLVIDAGNATEFGINLKKGGTTDITSYTYDVERQTITGYTMNKGGDAATATTSGNLELKNGKLYVDLYIDRSAVEAFFNDTKSFSIRAYVNDVSSQGIDIFADAEISIESLYVATMTSIYE